MTGRNVLFDTVIVAAVLNGEQRVVDRLPEVVPYISAITVGELYFGAFLSGRFDENIAKIQHLERTFGVLVTDSATGEFYGRLKADLRAIGRPIPENDIWIAATASEYRLPLVTRDRHFDYVSGLEVEQW
jgi:tRNA(fMet)-specific endonuclease VapC